MRLISALVLLTFACVSGALAQQPRPVHHPVGEGSLVGTVRTADSRLPIAHALVRVETLTRSSTTDETGAYTLRDVPRGKWVVRVSALGYETVRRTVEVSRDSAVALNLLLHPQAIVLSGVEVQGRRQSAVVAGAGSPTMRLEPGVVKALPALAEADLLQAVRILPSVQSASDFSSAPYVRGGSSDQNLVLLDGVSLFNPYHLGGVFGAIDPDVVASVDVLPGAFPARAGDRLSSVIDIRTRDGDRDRIRGSGALGLVSTRASLEGPLPGDRGSFLVSARRTYLDWITDAAYALDILDSTLPYAFSDAYLKLAHDIGYRSRIAASFYLNDEDFRIPRELDFRGTTDFTWGSRAASVVLDSWLATGLRGELRGGWSSFRGLFDARVPMYTPRGRTDSLRSILDARSQMRDLQLAADLTWTRGRQEVRGGVQWNRYLLSHDIAADPMQFGGYVPELQRRDTPHAFAAYVEDEWTPSEAWRLRAGVRVLQAGDRGTAWLPRIGAEWRARPELTLSIGAGRSAQVLHSLRNEESIAASFLAYDFLGAVPPGEGLSRVWDVTAGAAWVADATSVRLDAYAKRLDGLLLPPHSAMLPTSPVLVADSFRVGTGAVQGLEMLVQHLRGRAEFMLSYALTAATTRVDTLTYPPRYMRRHTLDGTAALPLGQRGYFTTRLALASGQPYTPVINQLPGYRYDAGQGTLAETGMGRGPFVMGSHNSELLPGYLRLDLGVRRSFTRKWWGRSVTVTPFLQVLNVLNNANVVATSPDDAGWGDATLTYVPQLPIFPSFGFEWRF